MEYHEMMVVLNGLAQNQQYVSETLDRFKEEEWLMKMWL